MISSHNDTKKHNEVVNKSSDFLIGGFTVVRNKLVFNKPQVKEVLPFWISNPVVCAYELSGGKKIKKLDYLNDYLIQNLKLMGIKRLFPVQKSVIPYILDFYNGKLMFSCGKPRDLCISAPTGSGKTLAYAVPIVQLLNTCTRKLVRAVVVLPVRDLAKQVADIFKSLISNAHLRVVLLAGETKFTDEQEELFIHENKKLIPPDIIVCTPGRLVDHIYNSSQLCLEHVRFLVVDEADRVIVEEKQDWFNVFEGAVYGAIGTLNLFQTPSTNIRFENTLPTIESQFAPAKFTLQKILLSATLTHNPEPLKRFKLYFPRLFLATAMVKNNVNNQAPSISENICQPTSVHPLSDGGVGAFSTPTGLKEFVVELMERQKPIFLIHLIRKLGHSRILCFANSRETTKRLACLVSQFEGVKSHALHAGIPLAKRSRILKGFTNDEFNILICTDAVSRGIDIENVSCVVSYEPPNSITTYVHRIGRTARAGKTGVTYTLLLHSQVKFFKSEVQSSGKQKLKKFPMHSSKLRVYKNEYAVALEKLQNIYKTSSVDAFGAVMKKKIANSSSEKAEPAIPMDCV